MVDRRQAVPKGLFRQIPLRDARGRPFRFMLPDRVQEALHRIDSRAGGRIGMADAVANRQTRDRFIVNSLIQEAITSSQLEGASTTGAAATRMIRAGRSLRDRSERMILNNYRAMQAVRTMKDSPLTEDAVRDLHVTLTADTLRDPAAAGRLQRPEDERVEVCDAHERVLYHPPPAEELPGRLTEMVQFANRDAGGGAFMHPVVRAILLHFWLAFDHPFEDGNGRTARALFYWAMLHHDYWLFEFVSISSGLRSSGSSTGGGSAGGPTSSTPGPTSRPDSNRSPPPNERSPHRFCSDFLRVRPAAGWLWYTSLDDVATWSLPAGLAPDSISAIAVSPRATLRSATRFVWTASTTVGWRPVERFTSTAARRIDENSSEFIQFS